MASSIQASHIVDRIARETERVLDEVFPGPRDGSAPVEATRSIPVGTPILAQRSGYIRSIDELGLLAAAQASNTAIRVDRYVGQFVMEGTPVLEVAPPDRVTEGLSAACRDAFNLGPARTMQHDVEFGVLQIVDIALRAISPAVNDPTTALTCIDHLGRILVRAAQRRSPIATLDDAEGNPRVTLRRTSFPRLLEVAFSQISHYGKADVAVPLRMLRVLAELASAIPTPPDTVAVLAQARRLVAGCADGFPEADRQELNQRLAAVEQVAVSATAAAENDSRGDPSRND